MTTSTDTLFQEASLSMAAYASGFQPGMTGNELILILTNSVVGAGMTDTQAER